MSHYVGAKLMLAFALLADTAPGVLIGLPQPLCCLSGHLSQEHQTHLQILWTSAPSFVM